MLETLFLGDFFTIGNIVALFGNLMTQTENYASLEPWELYRICRSYSCLSIMLFLIRACGINGVRSWGWVQG
jgi:hypothetical protein